MSLIDSMSSFNWGGIFNLLKLEKHLRRLQFIQFTKSKFYYENSSSNYLYQFFDFTMNHANFSISWKGKKNNFKKIQPLTFIKTSFHIISDAKIEK